MPDDTAQFSELLELRVDVDGFKASLEEAQQVWQQWLAGLGSDASGVLSVGSLDGIKQELQDLVETVTETQAEILQATQATSDAVLAGVAAQDAAQEDAAQKQRDRAAVTAQAVIDATQAATEAQESAGGYEVGALSPKKQPVSADIIAEHQGLLDQAEEARYAQSEQWQAQDEARADAAEKLHQRMLEEEQAALEASEEANWAYTDTLIRQAELRADAAEKTHKEMLEEEQEALEQSEEANFAYTDALIAQAELRADRAAQIDQEISEERQESLERDLEANFAYTDSLIAQAEARADAAIKTDEEIQIGHQRANDGGGGFTNFFNAENVSRLAQFVVLWKILSEAINVVTTALEAPFKALESGITYLSALEAKADELTGVLDANVKFSDDLVENFKRAAEAAPEVVKALQDAAISSHTNPNQLSNIFKALINNGATAGVENLQQLVQLATMYGMALKASGASAQSVQRAVMEIPKAMEGTLPPTAKWLQVLGLTNDQWVSLRDKGLQYHDLVERIGNLPSMRAHLQALGKMKDDYQSSVASLELLINRLEAAGAQPLFDSVKGWLKELNDWITQNEGKLSSGLQDFANVLTRLAESLGMFVKTLVDIPFAIPALKIIEDVFLAIAAAADTLLLPLRMAFALMTGDLTEAKLALEDYKKEIDKFSDDKNENTGQRFVSKSKPTYDHTDVYAGQVYGPDGSPLDITRALPPSERTHSRSTMDSALDYVGGPSKPLQQPIGNKTPPPAALATPAKDYRKDFDASKQQFSADAEEIAATEKHMADATLQAVAARTKSHADASKEIAGYVAQEIASLQQEKQAVDAQYTKSRSETAAGAGATGKERQQKSEALKALDADHEAFNTRYRKLVDSLNESVAVANIAAATEQTKIQEDHFKAEIALKEDAVKRELALVKFQASNSYLTQVEAFDKETALIQRQRQIKVQADQEQLNRLGQGTPDRAKLQDQMDRSAGQYADDTGLRTQERDTLAERQRQQQVEAADKVRAAQADMDASSGALALTASPNIKSDVQDDFFSAMEKELDIQIREKQETLEHAAALGLEAAATSKLVAELQGLYTQRLKNYNARLGEVNQGIPSKMNGVVDRAIIQRGADEAQQDVNFNQQKLNAFVQQNPGVPANPIGLDPKLVMEFLALTQALAVSKESLQAWKDALDASKPDAASNNAQFLNKLTGMNLGDTWKKARNADGHGDGDDPNNNTSTGAGGVTGYDAEIAVAGKALANTFQGLASDFLNIQAQWRAGNPAGAIGSALSDVGNLIPGIGGVITGAVGGIMSAIGGLFTAAAANIAQDITQEVSNTMQLYSTKQADLVETIASLQAEETNAIQSLSGQKGGQAQLQKILPGIQEQLSSLQQQALNTSATFEFMTENLVLQNSTMSQMNQEWEQINQQVADYLSAGGNALTAQQALSATLQQMQIQATNSLNQDNDQAVQDAINLNGLLEQRLQLQMQYNEQVYAVLTQGSIQRQAGAVTQGEQLEQLSAQYAQQVTDLNSQITLTQEKVAAEGQIFTIAQNINDLHAQDAQLQMDALNYQLQQYTALQKIVAGITQDASGNFSTTPGLFQQLPTTINVELNLSGYTLTATGTVQPNGTITPPAGAGDVSDQIASKIRQGAYLQQ